MEIIGYIKNSISELFSLLDLNGDVILMDTWQGLHSWIALNKAICLAGEAIPLSIVEWPLDCFTKKRTGCSSAASNVTYI